MKYLRAGLFMVTLLVSPAIAVLIADFDSGAKPSNIGGDFGAWDKDPQDLSQGCRESFDSTHALHGTGWCMMITYDVESENPAYNGFWMQLNEFDAAACSNVVLWIKSDPVIGGASRVKIELKTPTERGAHYIEGITSEWQKFTIPLFDFLLGDTTKLLEIVLIFEDNVSSPRAGVIYIDDLSLE